MHRISRSRRERRSGKRGSHWTFLEVLRVREGGREREGERERERELEGGGEGGREKVWRERVSLDVS